MFYFIYKIQNILLIQIVIIHNRQTYYFTQSIITVGITCVGFHIEWTIPCPKIGITLRKSTPGNTDVLIISKCHQQHNRLYVVMLGKEYSL